MPNYHIPDRVVRRISTNAAAYAKRALDLSLQDFPLTTAQVQYGGAGLTEDQVNTLRRLDSEGVRTIEHHRQVRLAFLHDNFPELRRSVVLMLNLPEWIVVGKGTQWGINTTKFDAGENHYLVPEFGNLDIHDRQKLITWVNRALRQTRLFEIVTCCLTEIFPTFTPTTSHLHVLWPMLTTLIKPEAMHYPEAREAMETWAQRFRNPTRSFRRYAPEPRVLDAYAHLIKAADVQITAGMLLPPLVPQQGQIAAVIEHWERLPGDPTFPVAFAGDLPDGAS